MVMQPFFFVVLYTVGDGSSYGNIKTTVDFNLLDAIPIALIENVNNNLLNKLV